LRVHLKNKRFGRPKVIDTCHVTRVNDFRTGILRKAVLEEGNKKQHRSVLGGEIVPSENAVVKGFKGPIAYEIPVPFSTISLTKCSSRS
jgi:hypothetical protein